MDIQCIEKAKKIVAMTDAEAIADGVCVTKDYITRLKHGNKRMNDNIAKRIVRWADSIVSSPAEQEEESELIVNLPAVNIIHPHFSDTEGDEEVALLLCSDGHAGKITKSFNKNVYRERMEETFQSAMKIVNLHRHLYPIKKLVIANLGDNIQGENPHQGSKIGETECGARDQVKSIAAPVWNDVVCSFRSEFDEVIFEGVPGNHGHDKLAPETSSYDLLLYDILQAGIGREKGITINVHDEWYAFFKILGYKFFAFHGDGMPCQQGVPFFALDRALKSWYMQYNGFSYALSGHFHKAYHNAVSSRLEHFMNGSLVSDDEWVLKTLKISSHPSQTLIGVHPKRGTTWKYNLCVDDDFLMEPSDERDKEM